MTRILFIFCFILGTQFFLQSEIYPQWNHTGPEGGEVRAFCVSGTNLFASPWSGGIYRSTDNGTSWTEVNNGLTEINITVTALIADGTNIFAGTWKNGVFLSTNYGDSWVEVNNSSTASSAVHAFVKLDPYLFMGSQGGGIARTSNNGVSWEQVNNGLLSADIRDLTTMDTVIFAATWGPNKVFKSVDNGSNWIQCNTAIIPNLDDPCIIASGNNVFLGTYAHGVFLSTDSGDNWLEVNNGIPANATIREFAVSGSNIFAATRGGGIFLTTDNGTSWNAVNTGLTTGLIESIIINTNQDLFAGTFRKGVFRSTDNGANWFGTNTNFNANTISSYTIITNGAGGHNLLAGTSDGVFISTDDGINWNFIGLDDKWVTGIAVIDSDIFVSTMGTGIFRTTDQGTTWLPSGLTNAMLHTLYTDGTDLFAGVAFFGGAQRSTDRGATWAPIPGLEFKWVMSFTENEDFMFAGAVFGGAFRSSDGGNSFSPINNGLSNNNVSKLAVMDSTTIFAGTGDPNGISAAGVFRSDDNGDNWIQINNGLPPNLIVWSLAVTGNNIFASSSSSGQNKVADVYLSTDRGENWSSVSTGLISNYIQALFIHNTNIFAGTLGSSTWWRPLSEMIAPATFQLSMSVFDGWNMVSIPGLHPVDQNVNTWWAFRDPGANVFRYAGGYQSITDAVPGIGYWMKHTGDLTYNTGEEWPAGGINFAAHDPIAGTEGWNLFGGYELSVTAANVTTNPPGLQSGPIYRYSGGYQTATTLDPGNGYWIKLNAAGQIVIPETMAKGEVVEYFPEDWGRIILTDAIGINYTLYAVKGQVDLSQYELPPAPPTGMFDIRFNSGSIAEDINSSVKTIDMSGITYPLTVRVEGMDIRLMDETGKTINASLKKGEDIVISDATIQKLMVSGELLPTVYSLEQNYPNPFNPSTVIEFSLPEDVSNVKLSIYNALGEKVAELVNTSLTAGKYQYQWNARDVATGMYIYELRTDKFVSVKKMLLLK